jgi:lysozyme
VSTFPINAAGERLLKSSEGLVLHAYPDPRSPLGIALQKAGLWKRYLRKPIARADMPAHCRDLDGAPWTGMYGDTLDIREGDTFTREEAEQRLALRLERDYLTPMRRALKVQPSPNQLAGMACLAWNIGVGAFLKSTVLKCHNRSDFSAAGRAFSLFNMSRGKEDPVLVARRAEEAALYLRPDEEENAISPAAMPQAVEPESKLTGSPIVTATTITAITAPAAQVAGDFKSIRDGLGDWLPWVLLLAGGAAAGVVLYQRWKQRRGGWA